MDKISGIIPSSSRITNVDMKDAPGIRATLPNADRGVGAMAHIAEGSVAPAWKSKEARQAALVNDVSNSFFMKNKPEVDSSPAGTTPASVAASSSKDIPPPHLNQPDGLFPKGSFIDRNA